MTAHQTASGKYKLAIIDAKTKAVIWEQTEWRHNLILNAGLASVVARTWSNSFTYGIVGTDGSPNSVDSGSTTAVCTSAGTVSTTGGSFAFTGTDIGNIVQWDAGSEHRVSHFISGSTVRVLPFPATGTVTPGLFTLYHANRTALVAESKRTNTYVTGNPDCVGFRTGNVIKMRRTYDFTAEVSPVTYRELGLGWSSGTSNTTFARIVIPGGLALAAEQQLRLIYQLEVTLTPATEAHGTVPITGWPVSPAVNTSGTWGVQFIGMSTVQSNGLDGSFDNGSQGNEPSLNFGHGFFMTDTPGALNAFGTTPPIRSFIGVIKVPEITNTNYTGVVYYHEKTASWTPAENNSTSVYGIGVGEYFSSGAPAQRCCFIVVFDQAQTKLNIDRFSFNVGYSWSRTLLPD